MAKDNSRYIQFYTAGSAAVKVEVQDENMWAPLPEPKPAKKINIRLDPMSVVGFTVAVCMLICMTIGIMQLNQSRREVTTLEQYVARLSAENYALEETYRKSYHLEEVRQQALEMGMVPMEEKASTRIFVTLPQIEVVETPTIWEQTATLLTSLFA